VGRTNRFSLFARAPRGAAVAVAVALVATLTQATAVGAQPPAPPDKAPETTPAPPPGPTASDRAAEPVKEPVQPEEAGAGPDGGLKDFDKERGPKKIVEGFEEAKALRTEGTKFFKVPDSGAHVAQIFTGPVHYRDAAGEWQQIDTSVVPVEGGFRNGANDFTIFMPETLSASDGVRTTIDGGSLEVTLAGADPAKARAEDRAVVYKGAFKHVDVRYRMLDEGYAEDLVLGSAKAPSGFRFRIETTGLALNLLEEGAIEVTAADGAVVAVMPPPFAQETPKKEGEPGEMTRDVSADLTEVSPGTYDLGLQIAEEWLTAEGRKFPVTLDPDVVTSECPCGPGHQAPLLKDMYTGPNWQHDSFGTSLYVGNTGYTSYLTFDIRQEIRKVGNLIYRADFDMLKYHSGYNQGPTTFQVKRITGDWSENSWDPKPVVDPQVWATYHPCNCEWPAFYETWWRWDVKSLMQYWIDTAVPSNHGWAVMPAPVAGYSDHTASFRSKESGPLTQPYLYAVVNAMPSTRPFVMDDPNWPYLDLPDDAPANGIRVKDSPPVLKIKDLTDHNGIADEIVVRYQVSRSSTDFAGANLAYSSGWIPEAHQHTIPNGALEAGTYFWRAQASDVCTGNFKDPDEGGANVCDDLSGTTRYRTLTKPERPTSQVRSFILEREVNEHRGTDPRWAQWRQALGNDMTLTVDQSNGNLVLEYPVTALQTAIDALEIGLSFNSRAAEKNENAPGLAKGWELGAGPGAKPGQLPIRLEPDGTYVMRVVHASGKKDRYVSSDGKTFKTIGPFAGTLRKTGDGSWSLTTYTGGTYVFNSSYDLVKARPSTTTPTMPGFDYNVVNRKLTWVQDPDGRRTNFEYNAAGGLLSKILPSGRGAWELGYVSSRVTSIKDPEGNTVELEYDASGRLSKVRDGVEAAKDTGLSTTVGYMTRDGKSLVSSVTLPGAEAAWGFEYNFVNGTINASVAGSTVTDPRGTMTAGDAYDFEVTTDFGVNGLPVMSRGPYAPGPGWPVHRWKWDENENLVCSRDPAANAISNLACNPDAVGSGNAALQTEYKYQKRAPYLITEELSSASSSTTWDRATTTYTYDGGLTGVQAQYFENLDLSGLPKKMEVVGNVDYYWPWGPPPGIGPGDGYSARFFGDYVAGHASGTQTYKFRADVSFTGSPLKGEVVYDDRVRVVVGDTVIIDCWNEALPCQSTGSVALTPGRHPILVEWADVTGEGKIQLRHETSPGSLQVVPRTSLAPNVDVPTKILDSSGPHVKQAVWTYPAGQEHLRLAGTRAVSDSFTPTRTSTFTYDQYGRLKSEAQSTTNGLVVKHDYVRGCETLTTKGSATQVMTTTERTCNAAGDVLTETQVVGNRYDGATESFLPVQRRTTTMTYDSSGRLESVTNPDGGFKDLEYDDAGRLVKKTLKAAEANASGREIRFEYEPEGWLTKKYLPAAAPGEPVPSVDYGHDAAGNRKTVVDERSKTWTYTHNSLNLKSTKVSPTGDTWSWSYETHGLVDVVKRPLLSATATVRSQVDYDYDVLGRMTSEKVGSNSPTTYKYDSFGRPSDVTDPDGVLTQRAFNIDGNPTQETVPFGPSGYVGRIFAYDGRGLLASEKNFRGHTTTYTYDPLGRLKTVALPHAAPNTTTYWYNDAGEIERIRLPKSGTETIQHDYDYTVMGYVSKELDGTGNVTEHTYNAFGEQKTTVDPRNLTIGYTYDDRGFLQEERVQQQGTPDLVDSFDYDVAGNMLLAQNETRAVRATYDDAGRLDTVTSGSTPSDVDYTIDYDYFGGQVSLRKDDWGAPGGLDVDETTFGYNDNNGFLTSVKTPLNPTTPTTFTYRSSGKLKTRTDPNGLTYTHDYDRAGRQTSERVTNAAGNELAKFTQTFDKDSHVVDRTNTMPGRPDTGTWTYEYDNAGRLTKATDPSGASTLYEYDGTANRTKTIHSKTNGEGVTTTTTSTTTYNAAGRPEGMTVEKKEGSNAPTTTTTDYDHDQAGNLTKIDDGTDRWAYGYDAWNRMTSAKKVLSLTPLDIPVSTTYHYDALDRTVGKGTTLTAPTGAVTLETERSSYEGLGEQLLKQGLTTETPVLTAVNGTTYAYGGGQALGLSRRVETTLLNSTDLPTVETATRFIGSTLHGDVGFMTDPDEAIVSSKTYDPWGVIRTDEGEKVDLGFQGDQTDEETGLVDMGARYYLPSLGRFTTSDTFKGKPSNPLSENRYVYGEADPLSLSDPTGHRVDCGDVACPDHEAFQLESTHETTRKSSDKVVHGPSVYPDVMMSVPQYRPGSWFGQLEAEDWLVSFFGWQPEEGNGAGIIYREHMSVNITDIEVNLEPFESALDHAKVTADLTFDVLSINDSRYHEGKGFQRDIAFTFIICGRTENCQVLVPPEPLKDCVGIECGRYPTMSHTVTGELSYLKPPYTVHVGGIIWPPGSLGPMQAPYIRTATIPLQPRP
jgi:RHS repeat-associated protein